jgi:membrane protein
MSRARKYVRTALRNPIDELTRGQFWLRNVWEAIAHSWVQLKRHRAQGMAAELTYRTIFSLIPLVVLGLVTFRIVGGLDEVQGQVETQLFNFFGVPDITDSYYHRPVRADLRGTAELDSLVQQKSQQQAQASIRETLREVTARVASLDFKSIGVIGLFLFIYAAIALADSVEKVFNRIFDVPTNRPFHIRLAIHWSIITLGSGLLAMSLYFSSQIVQRLVDYGAGQHGQLYLSQLLSILVSWLLLFLLYALMPNTKVKPRAALVASFFAAILWEAAKYGFQIYVSKALPYSAVYGSIGLIPLFLFWIYLTWMIVLFGLVLTSALQRLGQPSFLKDGLTSEGLPVGDPDWLLPIMAEVAMAFSRGEEVDSQRLGDRIGVSARIVQDMVSKLIENRLLHRIIVGDGETQCLALSRPAEKIFVADILKLAHRMRPTHSHPAWQSLRNLKHAERDAAGQRTLADVINQVATFDADRRLAT